MFRRVIVLSVLLLGSAILGACGGGGGGGGGTPAPTPPTIPPPQSQTITFQQSGDLYKIVDEAAFSNTASGGGGLGAISYTSDTPAVATVDAATGLVTLVGLGSAKITANKAADASFLAATANYTVRVAPRSVNVTSWVGPTDSEITFAAQAASLDFTRSSDLACDPAQYATCANGAQTTLTGPAFTDSVANMSRPAMYWLKHGPRFTRGVVAPEKKFDRVAGKNAVVFNDRLWVMAGPSLVPETLWSSADGRNWRLETADLPGRQDSALLVFQNALWLVGGSNANPFDQTDAVWKSSDGRSWSQIAQTAPYPSRARFAAATFNGRMWISGGQSSTGIGLGYLNDVWSSADGSTWVQATAQAGFSWREQHEMVEFSGRLWVLGGFGGATRQDIWSSADGAMWQEEAAAPAFGPRFGHEVVTNGQTMWLIGGSDAHQVAQRDVWSSTDGRTWTQAGANAAFWPSGDFGAAAWQGQLWMIGAGNADVWSSATGAQWSKISLAGVIPRKFPGTAVGYKDRLWVLGEELQLWSSSDGLEWVEEVSQLQGFSPTFGTAGAQLLVLADRLILIAGLQFSPPSSYFRQVWSSEDGRNWTRILDAVPFKPDGLVQVLVFNGKLWAFGGRQGSNNPHEMEIWSSPDAVQWTRVTDNPAFVPRSGPRVLAYNGLLWAIGGFSIAGSHNDVWSSPDGLNWTLVPSTGLPARAFGAVLALGDKMCLYGPVAMYEAWCSPNGSVWERRATDAPSGVAATLNGTHFMIGPSEVRSSSADLVWKSSDGVSWRQGYRNTLRFE